MPIEWSGLAPELLLALDWRSGDRCILSWKGRCLILVQKCVLARGERFIHLRAAPRPHVSSIASRWPTRPNGTREFDRRDENS
jgi:hypothetical protein